MARRKKRHGKDGAYRPRDLLTGATYRRRGDGHAAQVRVGKFKSVAKTFDSEEAAVEWANALVLELRQEKTARPETTQATIGALIRGFLEEPKTKEQKSFKDTQRLLEWWINKFGGVKVLEFGEVQLHDEARPLLMRTRGPATVNRYMTAMRCAWSWGRKRKRVPLSHVWPEDLKLKEPREIVRFLSDEERTRIFDAAMGDPFIRAVLIVDIATGWRKGELLNLPWKDIDLKAGTATIRDTKNGEIKVSHLIPEAIEALESLKKLPVVSLTHPFHIITARKAKPKSVLERRWRAVRKAAKLDSRFRFHDLRHTCASYLAQSGASILEIQEVLGHKSPAMAARYSHLRKGAPVTGHTNISAKLSGK
jgi:integrase